MRRPAAWRLRESWLAPKSAVIPFRVMAALLTAWLLAGCSGSADLNFVSLNPSAIDPPDVAAHEFAPRRCFWWLDDKGLLNVAMEYTRPGFPTPLARATLQISLVLGKPPAGRGLDYHVGTRVVRGRLATALEEHRFISYAGITSVSWRNDRLRGKFRIWLRHYPGLPLFSLFPPRPANLLLFGTFEAVPDAIRGGIIRSETESAGWRRAAPATAPAEPH